MSLLTLAYEHQSKRIELSDKASRRAVMLWRRIQVGNLDQGWDRIASDLERVIVAAQLAAASQATRYVNAAMREQDMSIESGALEPAAFTGVTLEGREIVPELYSAVTTTKTAIRRGSGVGAAFEMGASVMSLLAGTLVRDMGIMADKAAAVGKGVTWMVRVVQPGACSRCAILAGATHFRHHFERHPGCRCTTVPVQDPGQIPDGLFSSPEEYFESLTSAEQDRVFTKAGAEAIRQGADPISVVNARRGMYRSQQPGSLVARAERRTVVTQTGRQFDAYVTVEGTSRRGGFARGLQGARPGEIRLAQRDPNRRSQLIRLMPETIFEIAGDDVQKARALLRRYGYMRR